VGEVTRRRIAQPPTPASEWQADRDFLLPRSIRAGLGIRPEAWWVFESTRPDLAAGAAHDVYLHLREVAPVNAWDKARARLTYLAVRGELTPAELAAIAAGTGFRYQWRRAVLGEVAGPRHRR
jgi:hypothetical protein